VEDDSWGTRGGKLYLLANRFSQSGRFARAQGLAGQISETADGAREALRSWHEEGVPSGLSLAIAALGALAAMAWAALYCLRAYRRLSPRYASKTPPLMQGGVPGRAAVLAAATTDRALVVSELDSLFVEELASRAGLPASASAEDSLATLGERGASPSLLLRARGLLLRGRTARNAILSRQPSRLTSGQVAEHERSITELLAELDGGGQKAGGRSPSTS
jgi:hypothetical protein